MQQEAALPDDGNAAFLITTAEYYSDLTPSFLAPDQKESTAFIEYSARHDVILMVIQNFPLLLLFQFRTL